MHVKFLSDANWESKIDHVLKVVDLRDRFEEGYGNDVSAIVIGLICRNPSLCHRKRIRFDNATKTLCVDVMLDLPYFVNANHGERRSKVFSEVTDQLSAILNKRKFRDFDAARFISSLVEVLDRQLMGPDSEKFDHLVLERATGH